MILLAMPPASSRHKGTSTERRGRYPERPSQQPHRARPSSVARGQPSNKRLKLSAPVSKEALCSWRLERRAAA